MIVLLAILFGLLAGGIATAFFLSRREQSSPAAPDPEEQLNALMARATAEIKASTGEEMRKASEYLMEIQRKQREAEKDAATESFARRKQEFEAMTKPIENALKLVEGEVESLAKHRAETDAVLMDQIKGLGDQTERLGQALRNPKGRGDWGEVQLRRLVELAGMTERVDFELQKQIQTGDSRLQPDMIVQMPGNRRVAVDSKVALDALEDSHRAENEADRIAALRRVAGAIRNQIKSLASKDYHGQFGAGEGPDFVICHIRVEAALFGALEVEPKLYEEALAVGVVISTPLTLVALLRTIELGWRTEKMATQAQEIAQAGRDIHKRSGVFLRHIERVGKNLDQAVGAHNDAISSLERNLLPKLRHIEELGAESNKALPEPEPVRKTAQPVAARELAELEDAPEDELPVRRAA